MSFSAVLLHLLLWCNNSMLNPSLYSSQLENSTKTFIADIHNILLMVIKKGRNFLLDVCCFLLCTLFTFIPGFITDTAKNEVVLFYVLLFWRGSKVRWKRNLVPCFMDEMRFEAQLFPVADGSFLLCENSHYSRESSDTF